MCIRDSHIGAAPFDADKAKHRGTIDNPPFALGAHEGDHPAGEVVIAAKVGLDDGAKGVTGPVFDGAGTGTSAIVAQGIKAATAGGNLIHGGGNAGYVVIVEAETFQAFGSQPFTIGLFAAGGKHPPTAQGHGARSIQPNAR